MGRDKLTAERVRKFARCARGYLCAYSRLANNEENGPEGEEQEVTNIESERISPQQIEKMVQDFKTHRCALDFENKFIVKIERNET